MPKSDILFEGHDDSMCHKDSLVITTNNVSTEPLFCFTYLYGNAYAMWIHSQKKKVRKLSLGLYLFKRYILSILGANISILGVNVYILGVHFNILGVNMYILSVNMYILGVNMYI